MDKEKIMQQVKVVVNAELRVERTYTDLTCTLDRSIDNREEFRIDADDEWAELSRMLDDGNH